MSFLSGLKPKTKATSSEGKTMEASLGDIPMCQGCEENTATKFCHSCIDALCTPCAKSHAKYVGPNHIVTGLSDKSMTVSQLIPKSGEENPELSSCVRHAGHAVSHICAHCRIVICEQCAKDIQHKGHEMMMFEKGASVLQEMCNQGVTQLLGDISTVENIPAGVSAEPIDEAIQQIKQKHAEFTQAINACVLNSISRLEKEKQRISTETKEVKDSASSNVEKMEFTVTQLNNARKTRDITSMIGEITRYSHVKEEVGQFIRFNSKDNHKPYTIEDVLPGIQKYDKLSREAVEMFDAKIAIDGKFAYKNVHRNSSIKLNGPGYDLSGTIPGLVDCDNIVLYEFGTSNVSAVNCNTGEVKEMQADCCIGACCKVSGNRYVVMAGGDDDKDDDDSDDDDDDDDDDTVTWNLLDDEFKTLHKHKITSLEAENFAAMSCLGENEFVIYLEKDSAPYCTFKIYKITDDKIKLINSVQFSKLVCENDFLACLCTLQTKDKVILLRTMQLRDTLSGWFECSIVDLTSYSMIKYKSNVGIRSPYVDDNGDLLLCTDDSEIRVYRDVENGLENYEVLDNVEVDDGLCCMLREGDTLILGYEDKLDCYTSK